MGEGEKTLFRLFRQLRIDCNLQMEEAMASVKH